jgi:hypothetical protein
MTLQTRVAVLEKDVAALRSRMDNADVERDDTKQQLAELRAEMRGWAQITVRTDQKMDAAAELMQLIYADVRQTKDTLAEHGSILREHGSILGEHGSILRGQGDLLREHGSILREHGSILRGQGDLLRGHGDLLREHGSILREQGSILGEHGDLLREHGDLLREILARLDSPRS